MGASCSKSDTVSPPPAADLSSAYLSACNSDPQLRHLDSTLRLQTTSVLTTLSHQDPHPPLSLDFLRAVTGCLSHVNHVTVQYVMNSNEHISKNKELFDLVTRYFAYTDKVLAFFNSLNASLKSAHHRQLIIKLALHHFDEESNQIAPPTSEGTKFAKTLQECRNFKDQETPFGDEFFASFKSVQDEQIQLLFELQSQQNKLGKKSRTVEVYKKVSLAIFAACFVGAIVFSVVVAAIAAPPLVAAFAAAVSAPIGGVGKWLNSLWKKYESELKAQSEIVGKVKNMTLLTVTELENIRLLVSRLEVEIENLVTSAEFALRDDSAVVVVIADVRARIDGLTLAITKLEENAAEYSRDIAQGRAVILHGMKRGSDIVI